MGLQFCSRGYEQPPYQEARGTTNSKRLTAARSNNSKSKAARALPIRGLKRRKDATHEESAKAWLPPRRSIPF
jgi:hypothetical protein